jgi:hypothetical protein
MRALGEQLANYSTPAYLSLGIWALNVTHYFQREFTRHYKTSEVLAREGLHLSIRVTEALLFDSREPDFRLRPDDLLAKLERAFVVAQHAETTQREPGKIFQMPLIETAPEESFWRQVNPLKLSEGWARAAAHCAGDVMVLNSKIRPWLERSGNLHDLPKDYSTIQSGFFFYQFRKKGTDRVFHHLLQIKGHISKRRLRQEAQISHLLVNSGCEELTALNALHVNEAKEIALSDWVRHIYASGRS